MTDDVEEIRKALKIKELHLLGFSAGGFVTLEYAHRYPQHLTSLLMCSSAGSAEECVQASRIVLTAAPPKLRARLRELSRARQFSSPEYTTLVELAYRPFQTRFLEGVHPDWKATRVNPAIFRAMFAPSGDEFVVNGTLRKWDGRKYYRHIELPTLVLVGKYDYFLNASVEMDQRIEPAHLRVLSRSSHMAILEQPKEFLGAVRAFLTDVTGD